MKLQNKVELENFARQIRILTLKELLKTGYGHFGGSMSIVEALAVLYGKHMNYDSKNPCWEKRDYFILSKGHAGPSYYATLSLSGFFPEEKLYTLNENGTKLPSHPDRNKIEGVDMTTGSLGQGLGVATGVAYRLKSMKKDNYVYVIVGDGEMNEGSMYEAMQTIAHHKLNNLIVMVDDNKKQLDGKTADICDPIDFVKKFESFGFNAKRIDGHDVSSIDEAIKEAKMSEKPSCIVLDTVKGYGLKVVETCEANHHMRLNDEQKRLLNEQLNELLSLSRSTLWK